MFLLPLIMYVMYVYLRIIRKQFGKIISSLQSDINNTLSFFACEYPVHRENTSLFGLSSSSSVCLCVCVCVPQERINTPRDRWHNSLPLGKTTHTHTHTHVPQRYTHCPCDSTDVYKAISVHGIQRQERWLLKPALHSLKLHHSH